MADLTYPYDKHPEPGETLEIAEGVRWLTMPMGGSLNHINLYLLEDSDGWWVVDTGLSIAQTADLWHQVFDKELGGKPVKAVVCTHFHPDHIGQSSMITDHFRCPLYMTRSEYYQARAFSGGPGSQSSWIGEEFYVRAGMPRSYLQEMAKMWEQRSSHGMAMPDLPSGYHRLHKGDTLTIGAHDWRVAVGSGHSPEHACLYCAALGIMISGDQILPVITSNVSVHPAEPEANPLKDWMESHDRFLATPDSTLILPAHNLPFYGVRARLRELISHHEDRMLAIEEHCVEPALAKELLPVLFARELDSGQMMMALGEAIAHLHLLMLRNRIERQLHEDGHYRFLSIDPDLARRAHPDSHDAPSDGPIMV
ncbi:MAG: MBL fold metallo-hydrolase [Pseudomonadales bacterium]|jgi:glyoxylase-like metal-dependent hydrolase (beta-lactamase superfamily II)|nr:MBL fold metallo-hydrolase [Pseudomonadales bacterium]MDP6471139.1 MBL fold metallo-hydrolase [Pseudomonadales bacterium]MDP6825675.1 MBL fold metallo-hydrolase [Pseudomonadales bacterium]MDP6971643.1 MBL fold metallo-hydrolase [Pseudomonadales bacterium]|tara:strand:- start:3572 stop:4672 length:1101 start_codon:yes stop_codon:yes gene_type:complete